MRNGINHTVSPLTALGRFGRLAEAFKSGEEKAVNY